jgi:hypothetical protein
MPLTIGPPNGSSPTLRSYAEPKRAGSHRSALAPVGPLPSQSAKSAARNYLSGLVATMLGRASRRSLHAAMAVEGRFPSGAETLGKARSTRQLGRVLINRFGRRPLAMSAIPRFADSTRTSPEVREGPRPDSCTAANSIFIQPRRRQLRETRG